MPFKLKDLKGQTFGKLTVIQFDSMIKRHAHWLCKCECGNEKVVVGYSLTRGMTKSCGCFLKETVTKHGESDGRLHRIWRGMKTRCNNPNCTTFHHYGGRGIRVCEEWLDFEEFRKWAIESGYEDGLSIDRIENDQGYNPNNCRWVDKYTQANNKRNSLKVEINGELKTLTEWARYAGIKYTTIKGRYSRGDRGLELIRQVKTDSNGG